MPWQLDENLYKDWRVEEDDYFSFSLPKPSDQDKLGEYGFKIPENSLPVFLKGKDVSGNDVDYALATFLSDNTVHIKMLADVEKMDLQGGTINLQGQFTLDDNQEVGEIEVKIPFHDDKTYTISNPSLLEGMQLDKKSTSYKLEGDQGIISWEISVNKNYQKLGKTTLTDSLSHGEILGKPKVFAARYNKSGELLDYGPEEIQEGPDTFSLSPDNTKITFENLETPYIIKYESTFKHSENRPSNPNDTEVSMSNKVTLESGSNSITKTANQTVKYEKRLIKSAGEYDNKERSIVWTVTYNKGKENLKGPRVLLDDLPNHMEYVGGSFEIISGYGSNYYVEVKDRSLSINFAEDVTDEIVFKYKTRVHADFEITEDISFKNVIKEDFANGASSGDVGPDVRQRKISKKNTVDHGKKEISWHLTINEDGRSMLNPIITDTLSSGHEFIDGSVKIKSKSIDDGVMNDIPNEEFNIELSADKKTMTISFKDSTRNLEGEVLLVEYRTHFEMDDRDLDVYEHGNFCNRVKVAFGPDTKRISSETFSCMEPKKEQRENGLKGGFYDYEAKVLTWNIFSNYNENILNEAKLIDRLPEGLSFNEESVKYYLYTIDANGNPVYENGAKVALEPSEVENYIKGTPIYNKDDNTVTFHFVDGATNGTRNAQIEIEFTTNPGKLINAEYINNVKFINNDNEYNFNKKVEITNGGKIGDKSYDFVDGLIKWTININFSQSEIANFKLVDDMSKNQIMIWSGDETKPVIYPTKVDNRGFVTKDISKDPLVEGEDGDYTLMQISGEEVVREKSTDPKEKIVTNGFILKFNKTITEPYIFEYYSMPDITVDQSTVTNDIYISGEQVYFDASAESAKRSIDFSSNSGDAFATLTEMSFTKVDQNDGDLSGIEFMLESPLSSEFERIVKSDKNGVVKFDLLTKGTYILTELIYDQDSDVTSGLIGHPGLTKGKSTLVKTEITDPRSNRIYNWNHSILVNKVDGIDWDVTLEGAEFQLYLLNEINGLYEFKEAKLTDVDGQVIFDRLVEGKYKLIESNSPDGYILDTLREEYFTIDDNQVRWIASVDEFGVTNYDPRVCPVDFDEESGNIESCSKTNFEYTFLNYKGGVHFNKVDSYGNGLSGAEFEAIHKDSVKYPNPFTAVSDVDGVVSFDNLPVGDYVLSETNRLEGFLLNTETVNFTIRPDAQGEPIAVVLSNFINYKGTAEFKKVNVYDVGLEGSTFEAVHEDGEPFYATSDKDGLVHFVDLIPGKYSVSEVSASSGYLLNTDIVEFTIDDVAEGEPLTNKEVEKFINYKGSIQLRKVDEDGKPLSGALFHLENDEETYIAISDNDGHILFEEVSVGKYTLSEISAPKGFFINTTLVEDIEISESAQGKPVVVELNDFVNYKGSLEFKKTDADGNLLEGAEFKLSHNELENVSYLQTSDELGLVSFENIEAGTYTLSEVKAPKGYVLDPEEVIINLGDRALGKPNSLIIDDFINYRNITIINKINEQGEHLKGAKFDVLDAANKLVTQLELKEGSIRLTDLKPGIYSLVETEAPKGYLLDETPIKFEVIDSSQSELKILEINVVNKLIPEKSLPTTGKSNTYSQIALSMIATGSVFIYIKKRKDRFNRSTSL